MTSTDNTLPAIDNLATIFGYTNNNPEHQVLIKDLKQALHNNVGTFRNTKFSPDVTFNIFIRQILSDDHSCRQAMANAISDGLLNSHSLDTGGYCHARQRLPESLFHAYVDLTYNFSYEQLPSDLKLWNGYHLKTVDGTTLSMPDTPENQEVYPQASTQEEGLGFPILRLVLVFCLMTGAIIKYSFGAYKGKLTGEHSLLRAILDGCINNKDLILGDRYYPSFWLLWALNKKGAVGVFEAHRTRNIDFRKGEKLGKRDHIVKWKKPHRPEWMSKEEYDEMPDSIQVREFRYGKKNIVTTILDHKQFSVKKIGKLYLQRWCVETDIGIIKTTMQMDILRCKTPENIAREIGAHIVAYNLTRVFIVQTSKAHKCNPRDISHKSAIQLLNTFKNQLLAASSEEILRGIVTFIKALLSKERVNNRPGRREPRAVKRRPKPYPRLQTPRSAA